MRAGCKEKEKLLVNRNLFDHVEMFDDDLDITEATRIKDDLRRKTDRRRGLVLSTSTNNPSRQLVGGIPLKDQASNSLMAKCCSVLKEQSFKRAEPALTRLLGEYEVFLSSIVFDPQTRARKFRKVATLLVLYCVCGHPNLNIKTITESFEDIIDLFIEKSPDLTATKKGYVVTLGKEFIYFLNSRQRAHIPDLDRLANTCNMMKARLDSDTSTVRRTKELKRARRLSAPSYSKIYGFCNSSYVAKWQRVAGHLAAVVRRGQKVADLTSFFRDEVIRVDGEVIHLSEFTPGPHTSVELRDLTISLLAGKFLQ